MSLMAEVEALMCSVTAAVLSVIVLRTRFTSHIPAVNPLLFWTTGMKAYLQLAG